MLDVRPDATVFASAFAADKAAIRWPAPGAQQRAVGVELQDRRSGAAAVGAKPVGTHEAKAVEGLALGIGRAFYRAFEPDFVIVECARPVVDPDMIMIINIEPADLPEQPVVRQRPRPGGIDDKIRRLAGFGSVVDAGLLEQKVKDIALLEQAGFIGPRRGSQKTCHHQRQQRGDFG
ncbi:MAG TPA: hypothetical protein VNX23_29460 [Bradyrhizobium sp.]|uniref:hypothetical protein n=1 Tax=Bradyrhizobium sp. TaxID=376 RepID=UPI002CE04F44|nr:hypothetical protein [Bradyrhizobium sp.]HXB81493.1 hypothetical protein [Bradyrhizobium sp.]